MSAEIPKVAWSDKEEVEFQEYTGTVLRAEFNSDWANFKEVGKKQSPYEGVNIRLELQVSDPEGWENQNISYIQPSNKKGSKWSIFRSNLEKIGAWKDLDVTGNTDEERVLNMMKSIVGMAFRVQRHNEYPGWGGRILKQVNLLIKYEGRTQLSPKAPVTTEKIGL